MVDKKLKGLIKFVAIILILTNLFSCSLQSKPIFENCEIKLLEQADSIVPSQFNFLDFFCKGQNGDVVKLQYKELKEVYQSQFNKLNYTVFLFKLLNQEIVIKTDNRYHFSLNDTIYNKYKNCDFYTYLNLYCKKNDNGRYQLTKSLSKIELNTFSYLLFFNGYFVTFDDYEGVYHVIFKNNILCCK